MYIRTELDELEREEFYRLKKVQAYKSKDEVDKQLEMNQKFLEEQMAATSSRFQNVYLTISIYPYYYSTLLP
ncbi:hypothetical protein KC19_10G137600 [Ceratodon purpureus]|uniref:Uncharacterized protein n=1 Tax=Ceratodon purpureus TaxID=3225 RepID=A0A8T0GSH0_CERPU|nr:hypothetical protein KC19_10G137600 [Ceratodon purpureus]